MPAVNDTNANIVGAAAKAVAEPQVAEVNPTPRNTITNWKALYDTKLHPTLIRCQGYPPMQPLTGDNAGCHTIMNMKPEQLVSHVDAEHGGGFFLSFRHGVQNDPLGARDIKFAFWDGWLKLQELGIEVRDFRCDLCDAQIPVNSRSIMRHLKPHAGKSSRVKPGGDFLITLSKDLPQESIIDDEG